MARKENHMGYKWTVEIEVDPIWVADGFNLTDERAHDMVAEALPWAQGHEFKARVLQRPTPERILKEQGYDPDTMTAREKADALC